MNVDIQLHITYKTTDGKHAAPAFELSSYKMKVSRSKHVACRLIKYMVLLCVYVQTAWHLQFSSSKEWQVKKLIVCMQDICFASSAQKCHCFLLVLLMQEHAPYSPPAY